MSGAEHVYASAATNRYSQAADVVGHSLVAFGSGKLVGLWDAADSLDRGVYATLPGHDGLVTCVRWIHDEFLVSGDDKGVMRFWSDEGSQWKSFSAHQAHKTGIASLSVLEKIAVTGASDATVKVWKIPDNENDKPLEIQSINLKRGYPISLALSYLPGTTSMILAIGSTDRNVYLWTRSEDNFASTAALPGHEDWVKCLAFKPPGSGAGPLVLSSGSQDATVRLWNIEPFSRTALGASGSTSGKTDDLLDAFEASLVNLEDTEDSGRSISLKRHILTVKSAAGNSQLFSVTFDALLIGHEAGVTSLSWRPQQSDSSVPTLLSTSTDSSLILWSPSTVLTSSNDGTTLWINRQRFGDVGGQRLGGFVGGLWAVNGRDTMAWGWNGGWRRWRCQSPLQDTAENHLEEWTEVGAITGHRAPIRSIAWSPQGEYLISSSLDQTTRIHGAIPAHSQTIKTAVWHEIARPQVHGYDLIAAAFLDPLRFVSIADEKVARVFEAPREFVEIVNNLGIAQLDSGEARPRAAAVPPLGLSNKALTDASAVAEVSAAFDSSRTHRRPFEGELAAVTLWPEIEKVFGHGYESIALAVSNDKQYIATACKATTAEHAVVRVYDTRTWQLFGQPLAGHSLTVTQIAFSPDDKLVLSVSRDRTWRLFEKSEDGYVPVAADKSHSRIIWDCAWAPDGDTFVTASRDKTVKVWKRPDESGQKWEAASTIQAGAAATAVAFAPESSQSKSMKLAIGLESGEILIHTSTRDTPTQWTKALTIGTRLAHIDHIHRLAWRPGKRETHQLASCGEDGTLKLLTVHIAAE
ncbi:WD40 repeat-like protein [Dichomitus squalens]|uniref:Elongator complex protein 2 n=1 Tax=Dichomitus squalens TaxID=114155 RepID=A0A4Q9PWA4_9APHY|nr:WD40 repeat-like protein [Dichomitus squalens]TBU58790.1 WD40 repeat-like protein [Dichomitus squalens]